MAYVTLQRNDFEDLFPFYMAVDRSLHIRKAGRSCKKLFPTIIDAYLPDLFELVHPDIPTTEWASLVDKKEQVIFKTRQEPTLLFRGKVDELPDTELVLFSGTPWLKSTDEMKAAGLSFADFSDNDPMVDLLEVLQTETSVHKEIQQLLERVNKQKEALEASSQRLEELITNLQSGMLLEDEKRRIILINNTFCEMFGIPVNPKDLTGADCSNSAEQAKHLFRQPDEFVRRIEQLIKNKQQSKGEILELKDGRVYQRDYIPVFLQKKYIGHLWQYVDCTEQFNRENLLRRSEEKYRGIITNIHLGLLEVDLEENIIYANKSFVDISGFTESELIGKKTTDLLEMNDETRNLIKEIKEKRRKGISSVYEVAVKIKNSELRWWAISGAPLYNDEGKVTGSIGIHLDITKQKKLEEELRQAKRMAERNAEAKENFLANMSHEIRTPLSGIYGMMQLLSHTRLNKEQEGYIQSINKAIFNLQSIINDILDLSKINAGMIQIEHIEFSLTAEITSLFKLMKVKAEEKGLSMRLSLDEKLSPWYMGDPYRLTQVFTNILGNAIKFTEKGEISIRCTLDNASTLTDQVHIEIADTGVGIDKKFLEVIFEKFTQEESGHTRRYGGSGLGMNITRQLLALMDGKISIESKKFKGTTVHILIPLKKEKSHPRKSERTVLRGKFVNNRIIIAEDNEINGQVILNMLKQEGANTCLVKNGKELIHALQNESYDIAISDLQMPVMGGIEAAKWIRKNIGPDIRLIALTANVLNQEKKRCLQAGFDQVLFKPFRKEDLLQACVIPEKEKGDTKKHPAANIHERLYNLEALSEMIDHDTGQLTLLVAQFIKETPAKIKTLQKALSDKNYKEIKHIAHFLSSSVQHMGIVSTYETIRELDQQKFIRSPKRMEQAIHYVANTLLAAVKELKKDFTITTH